MKKAAMNAAVHAALRVTGSAATALLLFAVAREPGAAAMTAVRYPADAGVIDVTKPPFNARGDGQTDDTAAIQAAINRYAGHRNILYFPNGVYRISYSLTLPPQDGKIWGFTAIQGQSRRGTALRLAENTFTHPDHPEAVLTYNRHGSADWFYNFLSDLTIEVGRGNAGAVGLQFFANNAGAVRRVTIRSEDGQGEVGLDLGYNDMNGPLLVQDLEVDGFQTGIRAAYTVNSQTLKDVRLRGQQTCGLRNAGQCLSVQGLSYEGPAPAVVNESGLLALVDCNFIGRRGAAAAVINRAGLYARNVRTRGYRAAIVSTPGGVAAKARAAAGKRAVGATRVKEFVSNPAVSLFPNAPQALMLPEARTPTVPWDNPARWDSPTHHGAAPESADISQALQAAIDSGASTVYIPTGSWRIGHTVHLRGNVRRLVGMYSYLEPVDPLNHEDAPLFEVDGGRPPVVEMEGLDFGFGNEKVYAIQDNSPQTLVVKDTIGWEYRNRAGAGPLFLEDVVAGPFHFDHQVVHAWQLNQETQGDHITNRGGTLWILGLKTERGGTLIDTSEGGKTELIGGLCYTTTAGKLAPMFRDENSSVSVTLGEVCYDGDPYTRIVQETQQGETRVLPAEDPRYNRQLVLYVGRARGIRAPSRRTGRRSR